MNHRTTFFTLFLFSFLAIAAFTSADEAIIADPQPEQRLNVSESQFWHDLFQGQKDIWTAPFHASSQDMIWLAPIAGAVLAGFIYRAVLEADADQPPVRSSSVPPVAPPDPPATLPPRQLTTASTITIASTQ